MLEQTQAEEFAARLQVTIRHSLPGEPAIRAQRLRKTSRIRISAVNPDAPETTVAMPLFHGDRLLAYWSFFMFTDMSHSGFLKIEQMRMSFRAAHEESPIARLEFESRNHTAPVAHWQFHGERGAMSFILARTHQAGRHVTTPVSLSALHFPTGGRRFRPGVEDFIQFLIQDCGFDSLDGWRQELENGRELARRFQVRTIAQDFPAEVAEALKDKGWDVTPPTDFDGWEARAALREY